MSFRFKSTQCVVQCTSVWEFMFARSYSKAIWNELALTQWDLLNSNSVWRWLKKREGKYVMMMILMVVVSFGRLLVVSSIAACYKYTFLLTYLERRRRKLRVAVVGGVCVADSSCLWMFVISRTLHRPGSRAHKLDRLFGRQNYDVIAQECVSNNRWRQTTSLSRYVTEFAGSCMFRQFVLSCVFLSVINLCETPRRLVSRRPCSTCTSMCCRVGFSRWVARAFLSVVFCHWRWMAVINPRSL